MVVRAAAAARSAGDGTEVGTTLGRQAAAIRRYWWVVLVVVWLALIGAGVTTARTETLYLGRTSLIVSSNDRSPDQDAVLVQGYVTYFDDDSYQEQLLSQAKVSDAVSVEAQAAAASPILVITVATTDVLRAQADAVAVGQTFRDEMNEVHGRTTQAELATLNDQLDTASARGSKADQTVIAGLQDRIQQLKDDQVNVLQDLQVNGGVTTQSPSWANNLLLALVGGLFAGILAAVALAKFSPRLRSAQDVADKVGIDTLVELPRPGAGGVLLVRAQRLRKLANTVRAQLGGPGVVSVTQLGDGAASWVVAREVALEWATHGYPTVLVRLGSEAPDWRIGGSRLNEVQPLEERAALSRLRSGPVPGLSVLDLRPRHVGATTSLPLGRIAELLKLEPLAGSLVILEAPGIADSAVAQAASLAASATLLVLDPQQARVAEAREAVDVLDRSGAVLLGAVLVPGGEDQAPSQHGLPEDADGHRPASASLDKGSSTGGGWSWWSSSTRSGAASSDWELLEQEAEPARDVAQQPVHDVAQNGSSSGIHTR